MVMLTLWVFRIGVFATLTNSYALVALGASENFYRYVFLVCGFELVSITAPHPITTTTTRHEQYTD